MADASQYRDSATAIKPIETVYRGHRFRSRLEARWAVFFDTAGISWQYEPQGFEKGKDRYLPDFRLEIGKLEVWAEVKGDPDWLSANVDRIDHWFSGEPIVPGGRLLLLGAIPADGHGALFIKAFASGKDEARCGWVSLECLNGWSRLTVWPANLMGYFQGPESLAGFQPFFGNTRLGYSTIRDASTAARMARFEHGESGAR